MDDQGIIRAVAEKVMGWTEYIPTSKDRYWQSGYGNVGLKPYYKLKGHSIGFKVGEWNPLTNANHAFMVVEKMREKGWDFKASIRQESLWCVLFEQYPALSPYVDVFNKDLGHAICLAALKALEEK